jgi:predicted dehydrogenase
MQSTRREFIKTTAAAGVAASVPFIWTSKSGRAQQPDSRPTVACIAIGGSRGRYSRGRDIAFAAARHARIIAVVETDDLHAAEFKQNVADGGPRRGGRGRGRRGRGEEGQGGEQAAQRRSDAPQPNPLNQVASQITAYRDYRVMLEKEKPDIVTIGTPDHWHVPIAVACLKAGCDVYCEKPLTLTIEEGNLIRDAVKQSGKVFQVGSQQRTEFGQNFLKAIAIVQSGRLGKNVTAHVAVDSSTAGGPFESVAPPSDIDWDMWTGPAQVTGYSVERAREFRWYYDNSGGQLTDWGAHHVDIAQWALGKSNTNPVKVSGTGKFPPVVPEKFDWAAYFAGEAKLPSNAYHTALEFHLNLEYADGTVMTLHNLYDPKDGRAPTRNGIHFEGEDGRILVNRNRIVGAPIERLSEADNKEIADRVVQLYGGAEPTNHMQNFFNCVKSRKQPISDVYTHVRSMNTQHICNIALMLGRDVKWDPEKEVFIGDEQATALTKRPRRDKYSWAATT